MIFMPPRHGKSELASIKFPGWYLGKNPTKSIISCSYSADLSEEFGRFTRNLVDTEIHRAIFPNSQLCKGSKSATRWMVSTRGGYRATGVGGSITGAGADVLIIDDPLKNREEAESDLIRRKIWDWYTSTAFTRLEKDGAVILILCMTGDTPVLMADGTEKHLKNIRIGDDIATYDNGKLSTSTVKNWKSNGRDSVLKITTSSGKIVRANKRHPFLTYHNNKLEWTKTKNLTTDHKIVTLKGSETSGKVKPEKLPLPLQNTSDFTLEDIISIEDDGEEEVFDLQVEGTENFIANGVVSHNTRWHDDDLAGRILEQEGEKSQYYDPKEGKWKKIIPGNFKGNPGKWDVIRFPAIATEDEHYRRKNQALWPDKYDERALNEIKTSVGLRDWGALYQQDPVIEEGQEFRPEWFKYWKILPNTLKFVTTVDLAISKKSTADDSVVMTTAMAPDDKIYVIEYKNWKASPTEVIEEIYRQNDEYNSRVAVEAVGYQQALMHFMQLEGQRRGKYLHVEPIHTRSNKEVKIRGLIPYYSNGLIFHPPAGADELEDQLKRFPSGRRDDICDALSMAIPYLKKPFFNKRRDADLLGDIGLSWHKDGTPYMKTPNKDVNPTFRYPR